MSDTEKMFEREVLTNDDFVESDSLVKTNLVVKFDKERFIKEVTKFRIDVERILMEMGLINPKLDLKTFTIKHDGLEFVRVMNYVKPEVPKPNIENVPVYMDEKINLFIRDVKSSYKAIIDCCVEIE